MRTGIKRRQFRGLIIHSERHRATKYPRRLVNRTASWGEPPVNGKCRWCYEQTASMNTRWHMYCLNAYFVASGQKPAEIQLTLCEICGDEADEIDHRLSIVVARALGPDAELRAFTLANLRWLCQVCHRRKTRQDGIIARAIRACGLDWYRAKRVVKGNYYWIIAFMLPWSLGRKEEEPDKWEEAA